MKTWSRINAVAEAVLFGGVMAAFAAIIVTGALAIFI